MRLMHLHERLSARGGAERHLISLLKHQQGRCQTLLAVGFDDGSLPEGERRSVGPWLRVKGLARRGLHQRGRGPPAAAWLRPLRASPPISSTCTTSWTRPSWTWPPPAPPR